MSSLFSPYSSLPDGVCERTTIASRSGRALQSLKTKRVLSKLVPIALVLLCTFNGLQNNPLGLARELQEAQHGTGKVNGRFKYCRTPYVVREDLMESLPEVVSPQDRMNTPPYIQLCEAFLERSSLEANKLARLPQVVVQEDDATCLDWTSPHYSVLSIFASSLIASKSKSLGLKLGYRHGCHNHISSTRQNEQVHYDYTTAQQVLSENLISTSDTDDVDTTVIETLCRGCVNHHQKMKAKKEFPDSYSGTTHHCFLLPGGASAKNIVESNKELPMAAIMKSLVDRMRRMAEDWIDASDALEKEQESGVIIGLDEKASYMDMTLYDNAIVGGITSIQILASANCAVAAMNNKSDCLKQGQALKAHFKKKYAGVYVRYDIVASTATSFARMMSAKILVCPPGSTMCLLPALGKLAGRKAYIAENGSSPETFHWFANLSEKRKHLGLENLGYDAVADEDYLVISEEASQNSMPANLPLDDLDGRSNLHSDSEETSVNLEDNGEVPVHEVPSDTLKPSENDISGSSSPFKLGVESDTFHNNEPLGEERSETNVSYGGLDSRSSSEPLDTNTSPKYETSVQSMALDETDVSLQVHGDTEEYHPPLNAGSFHGINGETDINIGRQYNSASVTLAPVYDFWHKGNKDHTFHLGNPWQGETKGDIRFYVFPEHVEGTQPVYAFWNSANEDHTFHLGGEWDGEVKKDIQFYAFAKQVEGTEPVHPFWNQENTELTFHLGEPWEGERKQASVAFYAFPGSQ